MEQVYPHLYVGDDHNYLTLKGKDGWSFVRCCKDGPGGHRDLLGYETHAAPKGNDYLFTTKGNTLALNFIDPHDPHYIQPEMVRKGLAFIAERLQDGGKVLVACNQGHSRGPILALLYLRGIGELPHNFITAERVFRTLYPAYEPGLGTRQFARTHWGAFEDSLNGR